MPHDTRITFAVPRHIAVGLDLVALADGCSRADVLSRAAARAVSEAGLTGPLEQLAPRKRARR
jgi:hypothetical protein